MAEHVYHWKHGWIPLDHTAALSKAKGNHEKAAAMLQDAHSPAAGMHSRRDVAKAALSLHEVPEGDRHSAMQQIRQDAVQHDAQDLLPAPSGKARLQVRQGAYRGENGHNITGVDTKGRRVVVFAPGDRAEADKVAANIKAGREPFQHHKKKAI